MDPGHERHGRIQDQGQAQRATAATVEDEIPRHGAVALGPTNRHEPEFNEPLIN